MRHTISCLVRNQTGVIAKVVDVFSRLKVNINSLAVAETRDTSVSRMTIVVEGSEEVVSLAESECRNLDVMVRLDDLLSEEFFARELLLVKVRFDADSITRIMQVAELFKARVIGLGETTITLELCDDQKAVDAMLKLVAPLGIVSIARTGQVAVRMGDAE
ncbi:MAG TPA: acetolactate synthase small subunit [Candidatus Brocadiia bacterium]|nr:acetolactate synthase small subunit [Candidatus Brocadiia bacterium]